MESTNKIEDSHLRTYAVPHLPLLSRDKPMNVYGKERFGGVSSTLSHASVNLVQVALLR